MPLNSYAVRRHSDRQLPPSTLKTAARFLILTGLLSVIFWLTWGTSLTYDVTSYVNDRLASTYEEQLSTSGSAIVTTLAAALASGLLMAAIALVRWARRK